MIEEKLTAAFVLLSSFIVIFENKIKMNIIKIIKRTEETYKPKILIITAAGTNVRLVKKNVIAPILPRFSIVVLFAK